MQLTIEQVNKMREKGLTDEKIEILSDDRGITLPNEFFQERRTAPTNERPLSSLEGTNTNDTPFASSPDDTPIEAGLKAAGNVPKSFLNLGKNVLTAVTNPFATLRGTGQAILGGINKVAEATTGTPLRSDEQGQIANQSAEAVADLFVERYGSLEAMQKTATEDPAGFGADVLSLVAGPLKVARGGRVADTATDVAKVADKVDDVADVGKVTKVRNKAAISTMEKALKLNPSDIRAIQSKSIAGTTPAKWLLERGISGKRESVLKQLSDIRKTSRRTLDDGLANISQRYEHIPVKDALNELESTFKGTIGNDDILKQITGFKKNGSLTLSEINEVKRMLDREIKIFNRSGDVKDGAKARGMANIRDDIKVFIEERAKENGFKDVKKLNKETQVSKAIEDAIIKREASLSNNRFLGLTDFLTGIGAAGLTGDPIVVGGLVLTKKLFETVEFQTKMAKTLSKLPDKKVKVIENAYQSRNITADAVKIFREVAQEAAKDLGDKLGPLNEIQNVIESTEE